MKPGKIKIYFVLLITGIFVSVSSGQEWSHPGPFGGNIYSVAISPQDEDVIYLGSMGRGIYRSMDSGDSWERFDEGIPAWTDTSASILMN